MERRNCGKKGTRWDAKRAKIAILCRKAKYRASGVCRDTQGMKKWLKKGLSLYMLSIQKTRPSVLV